MVTESQRGFVYVVCAFCAGAFSSISASTPVYVHDSNVRKLLFKDYNKDVRPASSNGKPTIVLYDITLFRLNGLDEMQHTMSTSFMLYKEWHDERLRWNKTEFGGLDNISVPVEKLWKPDMVLFNIVGQSYEHVYGADAFVRYDGSVMWIPMVTADTWCSLNFRKFPFDTQTCYMTFGSWIYSANQLIFRLASDSNATEKDGNIFSNDAEGNSANIEWNILKFTQGHRLVQYMEGIPDWAEVTVTLQLRRIGRYYQSLFVAPIVMLAALIPIVFLLPPDATEKPILGSLILLAICILLINLQSVMLPAHYAMPRLVMFYVSSLVLASVSVFVSAAVCNIAKRSKRLRGVPGWLGAIFLGRCGLRKVLCVEAYSPVSRFDSLIPTSDGMQPEEDDVGTEMTGAAENSTHRELREIRRCLYAMANKFNNDDSVNNLSREWYEIARVLDRLLLVIFYFLLFLTALAFLL